MVQILFLPFKKGHGINSIIPIIFSDRSHLRWRVTRVASMEQFLQQLRKPGEQSHRKCTCPRCNLNPSQHFSLPQGRVPPPAVSGIFSLVKKFAPNGGSWFFSDGFKLSGWDFECLPIWIFFRHFVVRFSWWVLTACKATTIRNASKKPKPTP